MVRSGGAICAIKMWLRSMVTVSPRLTTVSRIALVFLARPVALIVNVLSFLHITHWYVLCADAALLGLATVALFLRIPECYQKIALRKALFFALSRLTNRLINDKLLTPVQI